jgi:hypothetical protein
LPNNKAKIDLIFALLFTLNFCFIILHNLFSTISSPFRGRRGLLIPQWISSSIKYISFDVHPKSNKKIDDYRRPHGKKRDINKIFSDSSGGYPHLISYGSTYSKYMPFNKMLKPVHK